MQKFNPSSLNKLFKPGQNSSKEDNGQVTIIGGSSLFHGAPILALKTASRLVDMVFFSSPEESVGKVASQVKAQLTSFIWVPWNEVEEYIRKSNAILIGPGFLRYHREARSEKKEERSECDGACQLTKSITETLIRKFPEKQWVIDGGSLQVMEAEFIPQNAIITPNRKECEMLFGRDTQNATRETGNVSRIACHVSRMAKKYHCIIVYKAPETIVCSPDECVLVKGGNAGLTKGGTGDVLAGLTVALAAKNDPLFAACAASFVSKKAADELYEKVGFAYNADDLADKVPEVLGEYWRVT